MALRVDTDSPAFFVTFLVGKVHHFVLRDSQLVRVLRIKVVQHSHLAKAGSVKYFSGSSRSLFLNSLGLLVKGRPVVVILRFINGFGRGCRTIVPRCPIVIGWRSSGLTDRLIKTVRANLKREPLFLKESLISFEQKSYFFSRSKYE